MGLAAIAGREAVRRAGGLFISDSPPATSSGALLAVGASTCPARGLRIPGHLHVVRAQLIAAGDEQPVAVGAVRPPWSAGRAALFW